MRWIVEVLERSGVVPADYLAEQVADAFPRQLAEDVLRESAAAVLAMRGIRDHAGDLARDIGTRAAKSLITALGLTDDQGADKVVVDVEERR